MIFSIKVCSNMSWEILVLEISDVRFMTVHSFWHLLTSLPNILLVTLFTWNEVNNIYCSAVCIIVQFKWSTLLWTQKTITLNNVWTVSASRSLTFRGRKLKFWCFWKFRLCKYILYIPRTFVCHHRFIFMQLYLCSLFLYGLHSFLKVFKSWQ